MPASHKLAACGYERRWTTFKRLNLIDKRGRVRIADFRLAKLLGTTVAEPWTY